MSDDTKECPVEFRGKCLLCGKKLEEEFYSGSYQTYLKDCKCVSAALYHKLTSEAQDIVRQAEKQKAIILKKERIIAIKEELSRLEKK